MAMRRGECTVNPLENPDYMNQAHRAYLQGTSMTGGFMKEFIEQYGEWEPDEVTEEMSKKAEMEAEKMQATEGTLLFYLERCQHPAAVQGSMRPLVSVSQFHRSERRWHKSSPPK